MNNKVISINLPVKNSKSIKMCTIGKLSNKRPFENVLVKTLNMKCERNYRNGGVRVIYKQKNK